MTAMIFDIERNSFVDGPGIRTTVFFKGCNLHCAWCHNPESQSPHRQLLFYKNRCTGCGKCLEKCPHKLKSCTFCGQCALYCPHDARQICGNPYTVDEILDEIEKDQDFYAHSGGGVTFSGGECMLQIDFLAELLKKCHEKGIHTAVDTAGHVPYAYFERIRPYTDLFLYDIKCRDAEKHQQYTGVNNSLILENLQKLLKAGASVWIRIPVIPLVNDTGEEMLRIRAFIDACGKPEKITLLPYHAMGENKYQAVGKKAQHFLTPSEEKMKQLNRIFNHFK